MKRGNIYMEYAYATYIMTDNNHMNSVPEELLKFLDALKLRLAEKPIKESLPGFREPVWVIPVVDECTGKPVKILNRYPSLTSEDFMVHYMLHDITNIEGKYVKVLSPLPTAHEILKVEPPKILEVFIKTGSFEEALKTARYSTPERVLTIIAEERLRRMGYTIRSRDEAPHFIKNVGSPDIIAEKDGFWLLGEVKMLGQLARYETANVKLVLITNMKKGRGLEV
uniref:Uncharacterized protein n=1 Tax=candidate division WOR-3 bacterium TaxID=2052148 RepID=A0A7V3KPP6_UNCW3